MASFRFCRTDDVELLVLATQVGYSPYFLDEQMISSEDFKREIKEVNIWTSSCMVASDGEYPFGVLNVAKRETCSLVTRLGINKDYRGNRYGAQMLRSLRDKMAILGPPELKVELPEKEKDLAGYFIRQGFVREPSPRFQDYFLHEISEAHELKNAIIELDYDELMEMGGRLFPPGLSEEDLAWIRQSATLIHSSVTIKGFAVAGFDGLDAYMFFSPMRNLPSHGLRECEYLENSWEILACGSREPDKATVFYQNLLTQIRYEHPGCIFIFPKLSALEIPGKTLETLGCVKGKVYNRYSLKCGEGRIAPGRIRSSG